MTSLWLFSMWLLFHVTVQGLSKEVCWVFVEKTVKNANRDLMFHTYLWCDPIRLQKHLETENWALSQEFPHPKWGRSHGIFDQWERWNRPDNPIRERLPAWLVQCEVEPSFRQSLLALLGVFWSAKPLVKITERRPFDLPVIYIPYIALFKITACTAEGITVQNCNYFFVVYRIV